jgi:aspartyl-tRNA(Asn)/glutamyl-tRNA(Gln) amidotransferase subunit B
MSVVNGFEPVIGLEVHAQLLTRSKMFCGCSAAYSGASPNTHVCEVCGGMPGALPVINARAVEATIFTSLALNCTVAEYSKFDRKNYSYPDLPKGYQISQYDLPLGAAGFLEFDVGGIEHRCGIVRVHLEEDTGKLTHTEIDGRSVSLVDYNRSGVPLMEIVGEPDLRSPESAREYFAALRRILMYLSVCDGNLEEGSLRADVNVSIRRPREPSGTKIEIKNLNSFRAVQRALEYEIRRQADVLSRGGVLDQETRGWSERDGVTVSQRSKEYAHDYRYFPEPDLPPIVTREVQLKQIAMQLPELPAARRARFVQQLGLSRKIASTLSDDKLLADFYEDVLVELEGSSPKKAANWITGELLRVLNESGATRADLKLTARSLAHLITLVETGVISATAGKQAFEEMLRTGDTPDTVVARLDLAQIGDEVKIEALVDDVLEANPRMIEQYRAGRTNVAQALVGRVMAASGGKANPTKVQATVRRKLDGH